jgi:cyclic pyranopterin phosphate synthase
MNELSHFDEHGASRMVDVSPKPLTNRMARASGRVEMQPPTLARIQSGQMGKGNVLEVARLAGIMAAKRTDELIPLCHSLPLSGVTVDFRLVEASSPETAAYVEIEVMAKTTARTGVEMEALTAVAVVALTIYDMCKAIDRGMTICHVRLEQKEGGASGSFRRLNSDSPEEARTNGLEKA